MSRRRRPTLADLSPAHAAEARRQLAGGGVDAASLAVAKVQGAPLLLDGIGPDETLRQAALAMELRAPAVSVRSAHTGKGAKQGMSKLERRYAAHLEVLKATGQITAASYEVMSIKLPRRRGRYRPDFAVSVGPAVDAAHPFLRGLTLVEVKPAGKGGKAYWPGASRNRWMLAAEVMNGLALVIAVWPKGDGWAVEFAPQGYAPEWRLT